MTTNPLTRPVPAWVAVVLVTVALVTAVAVIATRAPSDEAGERAGGPEREDVLVIGDSLTVASESALTFDLRSIGYEATVDAKNGRRVAEAVPLLQRAKRDGTLPRRLLIALGTNDHSTSAFRLKRDIDRVLVTVGPDHEVVWVNAYLDTEQAPQYEGYERVNRLLAQAASANPSLTIANWFGYARRELPAGVLAIDNDGVHYSAPSTFQHAAFIAQALPPCRACSQYYRITPSPSTPAT